MVVIKFQHPSTFMISGPTGCGKTWFVLRVLKENMIEPMPDRVIWVYNEMQPAYDSLPENVVLTKDFNPGTYASLNPSQRNLVVLDDQMSNPENAKLFSKLFTEGSHHRNLSVMYLVQNMFEKGPSHRTMQLNSHYLIPFKSVRDVGQIRVLGQQMFPNDRTFLPGSFEHATATPHSYMVCDMKPSTPELLRIRTNIFPGEMLRVYKSYKSNISDDDDLDKVKWMISGH